MTEPNKYLKLWPKVVENSIKFLETSGKEPERFFAFPAAYLTVIAEMGHHKKLQHVADFIDQNFIFLRRRENLIKPSGRTSKVRPLLFRVASRRYFRLKDGSLPFENKRSKKVGLNETGEEFIKGDLTPLRELPKTKKFDIKLGEKYEKLSNIDEIKKAVLRLYSFKEGKSLRKGKPLTYCPIPKVEI